MPVLLASSSPQRRALLAQLDVPWRAIAPDVDESSIGNPHVVAGDNARHKALACMAERRDGEVVLGCDTFVVLEDELIGKPVDRDHARDMLEALRGRTHAVVSGLHLIDPAGTGHSAIASTDVTFRNFDDDLLQWYLDSDQWRGRAGGYAIQERAAAFVESIAGCYFNVVGLPIAALLDLLGHDPELSSSFWAPASDD